MANLAAKAHVMHALSNQSIPWWKALAEFIDNSLDAGAYRVTIDVKSRTVTITDDGKGVPDILAMFTLGEHKRSASTKLGTYGIGAKDAWLSCADEMHVETVHGGTLTKMGVNYKKLIEQDWYWDDPISEQSSTHPYTKITLPIRHGKNIPSIEAFNELAFVFTPALLAGKQIFRVVNGKRVKLDPIPMPVREDIVQSEFEIDGKHVSIDIGILPDGVKFDRGPLWLIYEHRIIERCSRGIGQYSARRIAGTIKLGSGWRFAKNKDDLSGDEDRLADAIFVRCEHILKKADSLAESIESSAFRNELESWLNDLIADANKREARTKGESSGTVNPVDTGRKRKTAAKVSQMLGNVALRGGNSDVGRRTGFVFDWCDLDDGSIGFFERAGCRVSLNLNHPFIASLKATDNKEAIVLCAVSLIADYQCRHDQDGRALLKFSYHGFSEAVGGIVSTFSKEAENAKAV